MGFGAIAREHVEGWTASGNVVSTIADTALSSSPLSGVQFFPDLESLVANARVDMLDICTPHHCHWPAIERLVDWPGAVLVEKPLVVRAGDIDQIMPILKNRRGKTIVRTNKRFEPHVKAFLKEVQNAAADSAIDLSIAWDQRPKYMADRPWYYDQRISHGGVVLGMGIHYLEILVSLYPSMKIDEVLLRTHSAPPNSPDTTVENEAFLRLSCPRVTVNLRLACWCDKKDLPIESIRVRIGKSTLRFERPRSFDRHTCLSEEFSCYSRMILEGFPEPQPDHLYRSHALALDAYKVE